MLVTDVARCRFKVLQLVCRVACVCVQGWSQGLHFMTEISYFVPACTHFRPPVSALLFCDDVRVADDHKGISSFAIQCLVFTDVAQPLLLLPM